MVIILKGWCKSSRNRGTIAHPPVQPKIAQNHAATIPIEKLKRGLQAGPLLDWSTVVVVIVSLFFVASLSPWIFNLISTLEMSR